MLTPVAISRSGFIASGQVGWPHHSSGSVRSGHLSTTGTPDGSLFLRDDFTWAPAGGGLSSGAVLSGHIASGQVGNNHIASGAILSGHIASGQIGVNHHASGSVLSGHIASGQIGVNHHASGSVLSGSIASGQVGNNHLANNSVTSGHIASGTIHSYHIASGTTVMHSQEVTPVYSGGFNTMITSEPISGIRAVCIDKTMSGLSVRIAMPAVSGRMPAIGVVYDNVLSGLQCVVHTQGVVRVGSGVIASGFIQGRRLWIGRSGAIVTLSGGFASGGFLSGDITQAVGILQFTSSGGTSGIFIINLSYEMRVALSGLVIGGVAANNFIF